MLGIVYVETVKTPDILVDNDSFKSPDDFKERAKMKILKWIEQQDNNDLMILSMRTTISPYQLQD